MDIIRSAYSFIVTLDKQLFIFLNQSHNRFFDFIMNQASNNIYVWIPIFLILFYSIIHFYKSLSHDSLFVTINTSVAISLITLQMIICLLVFPFVFHSFIERVRPCYNPEILSLVRFIGDDCGERLGFFAPKTCLAYTISTFLFLIFHNKFKWLKFLILFLLFIFTYSRIYVGAHFPLNLLTAALTGILLGYFISFIYYYIEDLLPA